MQEDLDYATEHTHNTHTRTHHIYHSQNKLSKPRTLTALPHSQECGERGKYSDKKLFSYGQLGGVHHILLCLAFVLLYENMWCVWAGICIPITTCASLPWEKYARQLPKGKKKIQGFHKNVVRQWCLNDKVREHMYESQWPWFTVMPLHVIKKKEHQQQT